ncbi:MAG: L-rhamnose mutarotase [Kiritimatiellae bacterium]|nr:L-rhamnose mutarotase [Kiritimatiellia bacterium]MDD5521535.1 L-rhamnose mutarotase [Kiritimatiellia bacterium]
MIRKAFLIQAKPGMAAEYERRHNPIWPDLKKALKAHGISNYSIFLHESTGALFGCFDVEDEKKFQKIAENDVCKRWWRYMTEVLVSESDDSPKAKEDMLREVFHLD